MAKALFGHVGLGPDARLATEVGRLRDRVRDLENQVERLRAANEALIAAVSVDGDLLTITAQEPALT